MSTSDVHSAATTAFRGRLHDLLVRHHGITDFLTELTEAASAAAADGARSAVTLLPRQRSPVVVSGHAPALAIEATQCKRSRGPAPQAARTCRMVVVDDWSRAGLPWPECRQKAMALGVRSSVVLPLDIGSCTTGALSFHYFDPGASHTQSLPVLRTIAAHSSQALRLALRHEELEVTAAHLQQSMAIEKTVNQAIGIIMGTVRCSSQRASTMLRAAATGSGQPVLGVATAVVHQVTGKAPVNDLSFVP